MTDTYTSVNNLYTDGSYTTRYSGDIWIAVILTTIVVCVLIRFLFIAYSQSIVADWNNRMCDPSIIPFAGLINAPKGDSMFDYTAKNFESCLRRSLSGPSKKATHMLNKRLLERTNQYEKIADNVDKTKSNIASFRKDIAGDFKEIYNKLYNITVPVAHGNMKSRDMLNKITGTIINSVYNVKDGLSKTENVFIYMYEEIIKSLIIFNTFIISCFVIGWIFPATIAVGMYAITFLTTLMIPIVSFVTIVDLLEPDFSHNRFKKTS